MELIYSDEEGAFYWQIEKEYWATSQLFDTANEAEDAKHKGQLSWQN